METYIKHSTSQLTIAKPLPITKKTSDTLELRKNNLLGNPRKGMWNNFTAVVT